MSGSRRYCIFEKDNKKIVMYSFIYMVMIYMLTTFTFREVDVEQNGASH